MKDADTRFRPLYVQTLLLPSDLSVMKPILCAQFHCFIQMSYQYHQDYLLWLTTVCSLILTNPPWIWHICKLESILGTSKKMSSNIWKLKTQRIWFSNLKAELTTAKMFILLWSWN
jgi:hypothetical protein